jgi:hypothetical protein
VQIIRILRQADREVAQAQLLKIYKRKQVL